jgi:hypothetical protein
MILETLLKIRSFCPPLKPSRLIGRLWKFTKKRCGIFENVLVNTRQCKLRTPLRRGEGGGRSRDRACSVR